MMNPEIETLLQEADQAARGENWEHVCSLLKSVLDEDPEHTGALTGLAISKIHQDQLQSAVDHFKEVVLLTPDSAEAYNNLGVAYALQNQLSEAESAYQRALELDPENKQAWKNLAEVCLQQPDRLTEGVQILAAVLKKYPQDVEALSMLAGCYEEAGDLNSAVFLYEEIVRLDGEHGHAAAQLEQLKSRQAAAAQIARPEHAKKLAALVNLKKGNGKAPQKAAVGFYGPHTLAFSRRMGVPARALASAKHEVKISSQFKEEDLERYQIFIFNCPHQSAELTAALRCCLDAGKTVVVDLEQDYLQIPEDHRDYSLSGPGNPAAVRRLQEIYQLGKYFTVPNIHLGEKLAPQIGQAGEIPHGWQREESSWEIPSPERKTINFGLLSTHISSSIPEQIVRQISTAVLEIDSALLVAAGDYQLLEAFPDLPEEKKMFIPLGSIQNYPYTLAHFDILMAPEPEGEFQQTRSDLPLLEAGIRRIPWIAPPLPAYQDWGVGGITTAADGWQPILARLAADPEERTALGAAGFEKAKQRESQVILRFWQEIIQEIQL